MAKCSFKDCELEVYSGLDKCILHCEKHDYETDSKNNYLQDFYFKLVGYVADYVFKNNEETSYQNKEIIWSYFRKNNHSQGNRVMFLNKFTISFIGIQFPTNNDDDIFNYVNILKEINGALFSQCEFYGTYLNLRNIGVFYEKCKFHKEWKLYSHKLLTNSQDTLYQECIFFENVSTLSNNSEKPEIYNPLFKNCNFNKTLLIENINFSRNVFYNSNEVPSTNYIFIINHLTIINCKFKSRFILNNYKILDFLIEDAEFYEKTEFKYNKVTNFSLVNTNFQNIVDCFKTTFDNFEIKKCIFEEYVGFEECTFGNNRNLKENISKFIHSTFLTFINFRNAKFNSGLDLQQINLKEPPNFLNAQVSEANTNRETFRIIKYSFDRIGNIIEGNRFYAHEMHKYKEDLKNGNTAKDWIGLLLLRLYKCFSNYGQSIWRPLIWIFIISALYSLINQGYQNNTLYFILPPLNETINFISIIFNEIAKNIIPFKNILKPGMEFISLIFYIVFTSLIWLVILAIKRRTKR